jgi:hypothetical protein
MIASVLPTVSVCSLSFTHRWIVGSSTVLVRQSYSSQSKFLPFGIVSEFDSRASFFCCEKCLLCDVATPGTVVEEGLIQPLLAGELVEEPGQKLWYPLRVAF